MTKNAIKHIRNIIILILFLIPTWLIGKNFDKEKVISLYPEFVFSVINCEQTGNRFFTLHEDPQIYITPPKNKISSTIIEFAGPVPVNSSVKIYYSNKKNKNLNEENSVQKLLLKGSTEVIISLPPDIFTTLRYDIDIYGEWYEIKGIYVSETRKDNTLIITLIISICIFVLWIVCIKTGMMDVFLIKIKNLSGKILLISHSFNMHKRYTNILWFIFIGLMLVYLLFLNFKTPLIGEDYAFFIYSKNKVDLAKNIIFNIFDFFNPGSAVRFNLRIGDTLSMILLNLGNFLSVEKALFNILNSIMTLIFFLLIFFWGNCRIPNINSIKDLAVFSAIPIFFLLCSFSIGEIFFWCSGATNYLWAGVILLEIAIPYRKYLHDEKYKMRNKSIFGYVIISYIAGFTNENTVPIIILLGGFLILRDLIKKKIPVWLLLSVLSMGIGYSILLFSQNTKRRTMVYRNMFNLPEKMSYDEISENISRVLSSFFYSNYKFLVIFSFGIIFLTVLLICQNKREKLIHNNYVFRINILSGIAIILKNKYEIFIQNLFLLLISIISIIALFFAPYTEIRSFFFSQIFIIAVIVQINYIILNEFKSQKYIIFKYIPNTCLCLLSVLFLFRLSVNILDYSKFNYIRVESIKKQIIEGKTSVIAKMYPIERNKYINTRESYIRDVNYGGSQFYSKFYGAEKILWRNTFYEEEILELKINESITMSENVLGILSYDILSMNLIEEKLVLYCGNYDPQVTFSLEKPIKKISDVYFIDISYKNSVAGTLQVFYDFGHGNSEEKSVRLDINEMSEMTKIRAPIVGWEKGQTLYMIRIDPPNGTEFWLETIDFGEAVIVK